jgi:hypothetical protein
MLKRHKGIGFWRITALFALLTWSCDQPPVTAGPLFIPLYEAGEQFSFRGLHAADDSIVVVGGSEGSFCFSLDAGIHWEFMQIPDALESQFRSVWAQDHSHFIAVSAGAPSYIYYTEDRGAHWSRVFSDTAQSTFLDGIAFANDTLGWVFGDPVNGRFKLLRTVDSGRNWTEVVGPSAIDGEAAFAASGSSILYCDSTLSIVTGGTVSRIHMSLNQGRNWVSKWLELPQGLPSQGAFAHAWHKDSYVIVGGDYLYDTAALGNAIEYNPESAYTTTEHFGNLPYSSDVVSAGQNVYFTGTAGMYYVDSILHELDTTAMHSLAYSGKYVFASGPKGRIGRIFQGTQTELNELKRAVNKR